MAVLNWGLGHATRCEKLIDHFVAKGYQIVLASDGMALAYLRKRYPQISCHELPPLLIRYPLKHLLLRQCVLAFQVARSVSRDHLAFQELVEKIHPGIIISDNRYGCYAVGYQNYIITHQINPEAPWYFKKPVQWVVRHWLRKFTEIWIPDCQGTLNLSGKLSQPLKKTTVRYLGNMSRFSHLAGTASEKYLPILIVLSGPEPHRSQLEKKILEQLSSQPHSAILVRGTNKPLILPVPLQVIETIDMADTHQLSVLLTHAKMYIGRCGYTTLMDLHALGIPALLIPTPGQPEQEYLAKYHQTQHGWYFIKEDQMDLPAQIPHLLNK